jgi:hypothetical protein|tara:strand:+ start:2147 stop:2299 length:153 start_codon:yes stop_codon:yes gene_type:complete
MLVFCEANAFGLDTQLKRECTDFLVLLMTNRATAKKNYFNNNASKWGLFA